MGWCPEFGTWVNAGCRHAMVAGQAACTCEVCGAVCPGKYVACREVWAAGPVRRAPLPSTAPQRDLAPTQSSPNRTPTAGTGGVGTGGVDQAGTSTPGAEAEPESESESDRLRHLDETVTRMARELRAMHKQLRRLSQLPSHEERLVELDKRIEAIAADLGECLRLVRRPLPQPPPVPDERFDLLGRRVESVRLELRQALGSAHQPSPPTAVADKNEVRLLNHRVNDLGRELRRVLDLVVHQGAIRSKASDPAAGSGTLEPT